MKVQVSKIMLAASLFSIGGLASAAPPTVPPDNMRFLHAEDPVGSTAACLVSAGNPGPGIAACICAATGSNDACNAEGGNSFAVHPLFEASWAAALKTNESLLYGEVADGWYNAPFAETGVTDGPLNVKLDARGSCGLTQGALELAVDFPTNQAKSKLKGIVGAKAMYSAVYMFPVRAPVPVGENTPIWEDVPGTSPVRLCSLGQAQVMTAGQLKMGRGRHGHSPEGSGRVVDFAANLSILETGVSGAAQWVGENYPERGLNNYYGVGYVVVAGVADALLKVGGKQVAALGVVANARVTDRSLFIMRSNDSPYFFYTEDQDAPK